MIDLREEAAEIREMLERAVERYVALHRNPTTAADHPRVNWIEFVCRLIVDEERPYVSLCLNTRPGSDHDRDWSHVDFVILYRDRWLPALRNVENGGEVPVTMFNGRVRQCGARQLVRKIIDLLKSVLLSARDDGVFDDLPRSRRCQLACSDTEADFGWPHFNSRGKDNLV